MHRCNRFDADLVLDTWAWRFGDLAEAEAETVHRRLAAYKGTHWSHWAATRRRLQALPHHWGADQQTGEHDGAPAQPAPAVAAPRRRQHAGRCLMEPRSTPEALVGVPLRRAIPPSLRADARSRGTAPRSRTTTQERP